MTRIPVIDLSEPGAFDRLTDWMAGKVADFEGKAAERVQPKQIEPPKTGKE